MLGYFVIGALAAWGLFSILFVLFGWMLPKGEGCALCCYHMPAESILWYYRWLTGMGLANMPLLVVFEQPPAEMGETEICSPEQLVHRLEWERKRVNGTGTGDHTGRHQRSGISEL